MLKRDSGMPWPLCFTPRKSNGANSDGVCRHHSEERTLEIGIVSPDSFGNVNFDKTIKSELGVLELKCAKYLNKVISSSYGKNQKPILPNLTEKIRTYVQETLIAGK